MPKEQFVSEYARYINYTPEIDEIICQAYVIINPPVMFQQ